MIKFYFASFSMEALALQSLSPQSFYMPCMFHVRGLNLYFMQEPATEQKLLSSEKDNI